MSAVGEADWRGVGGDGLAVRTALHDRLLGTARTSLRGQEARQDDPNDPTTSTYRRTLTVPANTRKLDITVDGLPGTDLDLWVFYDFDGNGSLDFPFELVAVSGSPTADEQVRLLGDLPAGQYQIWVHGWYVPAGVTRFSLETATTTGQVWPDVARGLRRRAGRLACRAQRRGLAPYSAPGDRGCGARRPAAGVPVRARETRDDRSR